MTNTQNQPDYLILGEILRPHGVRGEMRMRILTDYPERLINELKMVYIGDNPDATDAIEYEIKAARFHKEYLLITLANITDRDDVDALRGKKVMIDIDNAVPLEEGEFYLYQLMGLSVQTEDGTLLGDIRDVIETGANDVYLVKGGQFGELLLPAHDGTIISIDFEAKMVTMNLPEGLLPE